jgi:transcriptional regulator with XRE-family HTH domain
LTNIVKVVDHFETQLLQSIMQRHPFSIYLERRFLEWQIEIGQRKSQAEFAKLLGVSRAAVTMWMNGTHLPDLESAKKIASVLGPEIFEMLGHPTPNPFLQKISQIFERLSPEQQQKLAEDAERYGTNNATKSQRASKERKTQPR